MRLWHKDLIPVLPRQQLLAQWRECCCIARNIAVKGTPNHILVNRIMDYPPEHFERYAHEISEQMTLRGYKHDFTKFSKWYGFHPKHVPFVDMFSDWHTDHYLLQCYYNLQEKYDCGGITEDEWGKIAKFMENRFLREYINKMRG